MPLAQIAEPWPTMELVQLEQEVPGDGGVGMGGAGVGILSSHFLAAVCSHPGARKRKNKTVSSSARF